MLFSLVFLVLILWGALPRPANPANPHNVPREFRTGEWARVGETPRPRRGQ